MTYDVDNPGSCRHDHWSKEDKGRRDRMVVGFTTTYAMNAFHQ
jgi:hypothetical protein